LKVTGVYPKKDLVEIVEIAEHPWFVGVQFHPEFQSKPVRAHPLFRDFIQAACRFAEERREKKTASKERKATQKTRRLKAAKSREKKGD
jgi:gamma-glutamyl-gamma-aminobutyrate hydrolase PuuD